MGEPLLSSFEDRSRALFHDSVEGLDMQTRSRLTQARHAALDAAVSRRPWYAGWVLLMPAAGLTAAVVLGVALWFGSPLGHQAVAVADGHSNFEDLDIVASSEDGSGDAMEMLQDDLDFYDFADKAESAVPAA